MFTPTNATSASDYNAASALENFTRKRKHETAVAATALATERWILPTAMVLISGGLSGGVLFGREAVAQRDVADSSGREREPIKIQFWT